MANIKLNIKKRFFNQKVNVNSDKNKSKLNFDFRVLISAFLVITVLLSGIVMMFLMRMKME